jgi:hypothetical protein
VEAVAKEAAMAALREIRHEVAMASLEAVSKKDAKVAVHELSQGVVAREADAQMYMDNTAAEEERVATAADVVAVCVPVDCDETEVEDDDDDDDEVEAERDAELRAMDATIRVAAAHRDAELERVLWRRESVSPRWRLRSGPLTTGRDGQGPGLPEGRR